MTEGVTVRATMEESKEEGGFNWCIREREKEREKEKVLKNSRVFERYLEKNKGDSP